MKKSKSTFTICIDESERHYMIKSISEDFPNLDRSEIEEAIYNCCKDSHDENFSAADKFNLLECLRGKFSL